MKDNKKDSNIQKNSNVKKDSKVFESRNERKDEKKIESIVERLNKKDIESKLSKKDDSNIESRLVKGNDKNIESKIVNKDSKDIESENDKNIESIVERLNKKDGKSSLVKKDNKNIESRVERNNSKDIESMSEKGVDSKDDKKKSDIESLFSKNDGDSNNERGVDKEVVAKDIEKNKRKNDSKVESKNIKKNDSKNQNINGKKKKKKRIMLIILEIFLILILLTIVGGCIAASIFFSMIVKEAPEFNPQNLFTQESSIIYSSKGTEIAKLGTEKREKVTYEDLPQILVDAIVATEDSTFFQHNGFNAARFLKASLSQIGGNGGGGASTLTMQVSKNAYTSDVSSGIEGIKRKFTDIYLSIFKIEKTYTKEQIMEFYVNSYYMGNGAYGVEQACQNYFGKSVSDINLAEAAMIAGIFQAPGSYDPTINPENTEQRRQVVLNLMLRHGYITEEEKEIASKLTVDKLLNQKVVEEGDEIDPRYKGFVETVIADVKNKTGEDPYYTSMIIYTTMDEDKQAYVTSLMDGTNFKWENDKVQAGIAVIDNNTGAIVAIGAGRNREGANSWNYATMIRKHIGSTSKPLYDYGPLIEYNDASTYRLFYDEPYSYTGGGTINNWDGGYKGLITMREALRVSRNIPALKAFQQNDNSNVLDFVTKLGLSPELENGYIHEAHSIGAYGDGSKTGENPLSVAAAYSAFANGGYYTKPYSFTKIIYRNTDEVYEYKPETKRAMSEETAYMVADMLVTTSGWAAGFSSVNGITFGSKTGTSNYSDEVMRANNLPYDAVNDLWVAGICRDYSTALWYGYDEINSEYYNHGHGNTDLYKALIKGVFTGTPGFTKPSGVVSVTVEKNSPGNGLLPSAYTPDGMKITELFKAGTEPTQVSSRFSPVGNVSGLSGKVNGNKITLTWNAAVSNSLSSDHLRTLYASTCKNVDACVGTILGENQGILGNIVYQVYLRSNGSDKLLHTTESTTIDVEIPKNVGNTASYVVKASYANNGGLASEGVETKVDITNAIKEEITAKLKGNEKIEYTDTKPYTDEGVQVLEGKIDVTKKAKITIDVDGKTVQSVNLTTDGTYKITYKIQYNDFNKTLTRTVIIKQKKETPEQN